MGEHGLESEPADLVMRPLRPPGPVFDPAVPHGDGGDRVRSCGPVGASGRANHEFRRIVGIPGCIAVSNVYNLQRRSRFRRGAPVFEAWPIVGSHVSEVSFQSLGHRIQFKTQRSKVEMMNKTMAVVLGSVGALAVGSAQAALVDYSTDFTSADGFSEGATADNTDGWQTRAQHITSATASYGAMELNSNGGAMAHEGSGGSWGVGDTITLSVDAFYTGNTQNNRLRIGLRETATATGNVNAGVEFNMDATASGNFDIVGVAIGGTHDFGAELDSGFDVVLGQANAETFVATFTKSATANEIDVDWSFRGGAASGSFIVTNASLYADADVYGAMAYNGPTGGEAQVDSFSLDYTAVPEPSTLALAGLGALAIAGRSRRKA